MTMTRRSMMALTLAGLTVRPAFAADDRALFWRIGTPTGRRAIVYGAAPIAATAAPGVIADGYRFVPATQRIAIGFREAMPPQLPTDLPPALPAFAPDVARLVRAALVATGLSAEATESLSALAVVARLLSEGAGATPPFVLEVLRTASEEINRPITAMLSPAELAALRAKVDLRAANAGVTAADVETLLALRARNGPLGAHRDAVYLRRRPAELSALMQELDILRGLDPAQFYRTAELREALRSRLPGVLEADYDAFVFLPIETLIGPEGILAQLRAEGCSVTALA